MDQMTSLSAELAGKYLTFRLGHESYGIEILKVQEIIGLMNITRIPRSPECIRGVINLRGRIIPVVDLRNKFNMEEVETTEKSCIIVVQMDRNIKESTTGVLVDEVSEVVDIEGEHIEPAPSFGAAVDTAYLLGIGKIASKVVALLDLNHVLGAEEHAALANL